jgi:HAE1 family hydrophobic/amphiphilic exporter-1
MTFMIFLALFMLGMVSLSRLGLELLPDISFPTVVVFTANAGVGPQEIESGITKPIEDAVSTLNGVEQISSSSSEGVSMLVINFSWNINMDTIVSEIREKVNGVEEDLPEAAERPVIVRFNPEFLPIIVFNISSRSPGLALRRIAEEKIAPELEKIEGVATIDVFGGKIAAVTCKLDLDSLVKSGIPITRILRIFEGENINLPAGSISVEDRYIVLRSLGEFTSLGDIESILLGYNDGVPIYLRDVAEVSLGHLPREQFFRTETADGVQLAVRKQPGHNTVDINRDIKLQIERVREKLPPSIEIGIQSDQSRQILNSIGSVGAAALQGGILAVLVLLLFLRSVASTLIIAVAIPVSIVATFSLMNFANITMNIVSLMGLTLGVGMFVDNSIVVLESSYRKTLAGFPKAAAAVAGTEEVATAITASTLTTIAVFFPLVFVKDFASIIFRDLAYTIAFALFISLVMALTLMPVLCSRFLKQPGLPGAAERKKSDPSAGPEEYSDLDVSLADLEIRTGHRFLDRLGKLIQDGLRKLDDLYERAIRWALGHTLVIVLSAVFLLLASVASVALLGMEFLPETDEGRLAVSVETRIGSSFEKTEEKVIRIEEIIRAVAGRDLISIAASVGTGGTLGTAETGSHLSALEVRFVDKDGRSRSIWQIITELSERLEREILDIRPTFALQGVAALASNVTGEAAPLVVEISGADLDRNAAYAGRITEAMSDMAGVRDVVLSHKSGKPELQFRIKREAAASLGLSPLEIGATLRTAYKGTKVSSFHTGEQSYDIYIILADETRNTLGEMQKLFFINPAGEQIPLENVVEMVEGQGPLTVQRKNRTRVVEITAALTGEKALSQVIDDIQGRVASLGPPGPGISVSYAGSYEQMQESFRSLLFVLLLAVALVYMVLASQFESFLHPLIIMFSVPFCIIGLVGALMITRTTFSMMSFIGAILLVGIVVNNAIVLIDYMNRLRRRGLSLREAIIRGGKTRLKPILMTSFTTIFGLLPMALGIGAGSEIRAPLGRAVIGGLLTSSLVTLLLIPTLYWLVEEKIRGRKR